MFEYHWHVGNVKNLKSTMQKLFGYVGFRHFAKKKLLEGNYDALVFLTANCAVLLSDVLKKKYKGRFIIDIRDYWHEDFKLYHDAEQELIKQAALAVISSPAYRSFLIDHDYIIMHNDQIIDEKAARGFQSKRSPSDPFVIACVGGVKDIEYDKRVISFFSNDPRFELRYIGRGYGQLADYCTENGINNVIAEDEFPMGETLKKYEGVDAILNMYGNHSPYYDYALSNKLYFAARLRMPILVCKDTYMEEISTKYSFGYAIDLSDQTVKDSVLRSYTEEAIAAREKGCRAFLDLVESDTDDAKKAIGKFLNEGICTKKA